ncbi:MAG: hypothetical protein FD171_1281 [Actinobacteria bacterium]|nr:MAG: hypothetical protein FD171_1281 [Actinomycetota bacterium]
MDAFRERTSDFMDLSYMTLPRGFKFYSGSPYMETITCRETVFCEAMAFEGVTVSGLAYFRDASFLGGVSFKGTRFNSRLNFQGVTVDGDANFRGMTCRGDIAYFEGTEFTSQGASVDFSNSRFGGDAIFKFLNCRGWMTFTRAEFSGYTNFWGSDIDSIRMDHAVFEGLTRLEALSTSNFDLTSCVFKNLTELEIQFQPQTDPTFANEPVLVLRNVIPGDYLRVANTDLSKASFLGTDLSNCTFTDVTWPRIGKRQAAADEIQLLGGSQWYDLTPDSVAEVYRGLRRNLESRLAYHQASDFYVGEMEMRLRSATTDRRLRELIPLKLYKAMSGYGENWLRPLFVLALWSMFFALLLLLGGVVIGSPATGYRTMQYGLQGYFRPAQLLADYLWAMAYAFSIAILRPGQDVALTSNWLRMVQVFSYVLGPSCITLALLAIRRSFRRGAAG